MVKIIAGRYGPGLLGPGSVLNLDAATEQRMVERRVAVYINNSDADADQSDDGLNNNKIILKTADELKKIRSKKELITYAKTIGLHSLEEALSKEALTDEIINYQEETFGEE
jgi:hypothetical protein